MKILAVSVFAALLLSPACAPDDVDRPEAAISGLPVIDTTPLWRLDESGGFEFAQVAGAGLLPSGRVVIADALAPAVMVVDVTTGRRQMLGRPGSGPGEYRMPELIGVLPNERIVVADAPQHRVLVFGADGSVVATLGPGRVEAGAIWQRVGMFDDGTLVATRARYGDPDAAGTLTRLNASVVRLDTDGGVRTDYGEFPWADHINQVLAGSDTPMRGPQFFGWRLAVAAAGDRVVIGAGNGDSLVVFGREGAVRAVLRLAGARALVPDSARARVRADAAARNAPPNVLAPERFADSLPRFGAVLLNPSGAIWVVDYGGEWWAARGATVFGADGALLGRVMLPAGVRPLLLNDSMLIGVAVSEDGAVGVVGFGVRTSR